MPKKSSKPAPLLDQLRLPQGPVDVSQLDARSTPGYPGKGKADAAERTLELAPALSDLQERLYAENKDLKNGKRVLVILQGLDTAGKGGVIRHAIGMVDPQGVHLHAFKAPTAMERRYDYLWRIRRQVPAPGLIGIFDRSHYEDVLIARVNKLVTKAVWSKRYDEINAFEAELAEQGVTLVKCFLNVSRDEQYARLEERLNNPEKYWKYNPGDIDTRKNWDAYQAAYTDLLTKCNTDAAPWYHVPADRKWYRNWAVAQLLLETLQGLDPQWPAADFDVATELKRLEGTR